MSPLFKDSRKTKEADESALMSIFSEAVLVHCQRHCLSYALLAWFLCHHGRPQTAFLLTFADDTMVVRLLMSRILSVDVSEL